MTLLWTLTQKLRRLRSRRRGNILPLAAAVLSMVLAFTALTVDIGYISMTKAQLQNACDAAALAAALELNPLAEQDEIEAAARTAAVEVAASNRAGDHSSVYLHPTQDVELGRRTWNAETESYEYGFGPGFEPYNIARVTTRRKIVQVEGANGQLVPLDNRLPLFFGAFVGKAKTEMEVSAVATFQPRDIMVVLDYSASMNDDSELSAIGKLSRAEVEVNIQQIWEDLGSPTYGNLQFEPQYATLSGQPASGPVPHIDVTWKGTKVYVKSTKDLSNVVLQYSDGSKQKFEGLSGKTGTFQGTGSKAGKRIDVAWVKSGSNASGDGPGYGERFTFDDTNLRKALGLHNVPYPYPGGSWNEYIYTVKHDPSLDIYRYKFGYLTLINYWNQYRPMSSEIPDLWKTRQQPITALKDAMDVLLDFLQDVESEDQVGLSVYTGVSDDEAVLESQLTHDLDLLKTISRQRQAGHYNHYTNIGAGMTIARDQLVNHARPNAARTMILMTDGIANRSSTGASPRQYVLNEADLAAAHKIRIMTISVGVNADVDLMQEVADRTKGVHFNVPGGASVSEMEAQLKQVFAEIAADRPLKLIRLD